MFIQHLLSELPKLFGHLTGYLSKVDVPTPGLYGIRDSYVNISSRF